MVRGKTVVVEVQDVLNTLPKSLSDELVSLINQFDELLDIFKTKIKAGKTDELLDIVDLFKKKSIPLCR